MKVKVLENILKKYYLGGIVDSVKWAPKKDATKISFISPASNLVGIIETNKLIFDTKDEIGIFSTKKLLKMLSIFKDEIELTYNGEKLNLKDSKFDVNFSLCQIDLITRFPKSIGLPESFNQVITFEKEFTNDFVTASKAIDSDVFKISMDKNGNIIFIMGDVRNKYSDKISLKVEPDPLFTTGTRFDDMIFQLNEVEEILSANKDSSISQISISGEGMIKFYFKNEDYEVNYYLVANQE